MFVVVLVLVRFGVRASNFEIKVVAQQTSCDRSIVTLRDCQEFREREASDMDVT